MPALLVQARLVQGEADVQIARLAVENARNLREAETEAAQCNDLGRPRHHARVIDPPPRSRAVGVEQAVLFVEAQSLGRDTEGGAGLRRRETAA